MTPVAPAAIPTGPRRRGLPVRSCAGDPAGADLDVVAEKTARLGEAARLEEAALLEELRALLGPADGDRPASWGKFEMLDRLGAGSYGTVYRARDTNLGGLVALKLYHRRRSDDAVKREQLKREARCLRDITSHPNVVAVYDMDEHDGRVGVWMELIEGRTLEDEVAERRTTGRLFSAREATDVGRQLCRAVKRVHDAGLVHGDLKAHNVMRVARDGRIVLMDFSAARRRTPDPAEAGAPISGTPAYLAPEVFDHGDDATLSSPRIDVYALGVLLFYLVSGTYPVDGTVDEIRRAHREGTALRTLARLRPDLPTRFVAVVERALARRSARPASVEVVAQELADWPLSARRAGLRRWAHVVGHRTRYPTLAAATVLSFVLGLVTAWAWLSTSAM